MKKEVTICDKCQEQKEDFINLDVLLGEQNRTNSKQLSKDLEIVQNVDICNDCCAIILKEFLKKLDNSMYSLDLKKFLEESGIFFKW